MSIFVTQDDTGPAVLKQFLDENGAAVDLTGATVKFSMKATGGAVKVNLAAATVFVGTLPSGAVVAATAGWMRYVWQAADTDTAGEFIAEFKVTFLDGTIERVPNSAYELVSVKAKIA